MPAIPYFFSSRLPHDLTESALQQHLTAANKAVDLTESNPTRCGFTYPEIHAPLLGPKTWQYSPDAQGMQSAREILAQHLEARARPVQPNNLFLTASTSEAYAMVIKLLCDPGDAVAVGAPTYPLVQHLAELEAVRTLTFASHYESGRWCIDFSSVTQTLSQGIRALVLIAPNNPTGACPTSDELQELATLCNAHGVVAIIDEVFEPYRTSARPAGFPYQGFERCVILNGLSKAAALPQLKLGWISLHGESVWVSAARERLAWIADTYLSVGTPVQVALPALLRAAPALQEQIRVRLAENRRIIAQSLEAVPTVDLLNSDGGWYAVLRVPQHFKEDALVVKLLHDAQVKIHPGYFYDLPSSGYLVSGLLTAPEAARAAWKRVAECLHHAFE